MSITIEDFDDMALTLAERYQIIAGKEQAEHLNRSEFYSARRVVEDQIEKTGAIAELVWTLRRNRDFVPADVCCRILKAGQEVRSLIW